MSDGEFHLNADGSFGLCDDGTFAINPSCCGYTPADDDCEDCETEPSPKHIAVTTSGISLCTTAIGDCFPGMAGVTYWESVEWVSSPSNADLNRTWVLNQDRLNPCQWRGGGTLNTPFDFKAWEYSDHCASDPQAEGGVSSMRAVLYRNAGGFWAFRLSYVFPWGFGGDIAGHVFETSNTLRACEQDALPIVLNTSGDTCFTDNAVLAGRSGTATIVDWL